MPSEIRKNCAYFIDSQKRHPLRLDLQFVNSGKESFYSNIYLSDSFLIDYLLAFCEKKGGFTSILQKEKNNIYIHDLFVYALKSFGQENTYEKTKLSTLSAVEHRLATMIYYYINNPSEKKMNTVASNAFEYFRSLILTKMSSHTQLLIMAVVFLY